MKRNYILLSISILFFCTSIKAQEMSADEIEFAKTGVLSIQGTSALKQGLAKNNSFLKTTGGPGCDSLETNYTAGNGQSGVMFDIVALQALILLFLL